MLNGVVKNLEIFFNNSKFSYQIFKHQQNFVDIESSIKEVKVVLKQATKTLRQLSNSVRIIKKHTLHKHDEVKHTLHKHDEVKHTLEVPHEHDDVKQTLEVSPKDDVTTSMQTKLLTPPSFQKIPLLQPQAITSCFPSVNMDLNLDETRNAKTRMNDEMKLKEKLEKIVIEDDQEVDQFQEKEDFNKDLQYIQTFDMSPDDDSSCASGDDRAMTDDLSNQVEKEWN